VASDERGYPEQRGVGGRVEVRALGPTVFRYGM
jgi:hypothetical protein